MIWYNLLQAFLHDWIPFENIERYSVRTTEGPPADAISDMHIIKVALDSTVVQWLNITAYTKAKYDI